MNAALSQIEELKERERVATEKVARLEIEQHNDKKTIEELNAALKNSKQEIQVMQEYLEKQKRIMNERRC